MPPECPQNDRLLVYLSALFVYLALLAGCVNSEKSKAEHIARGEAYLKESKFHEASLEFRNAIQLDESFAQAHWGLARAYEGLERFAATIEELKLTARLDPENLEARVKLGNYYLLYTPPLTADAQKLADYALKHNPNHIEATILKASALAAMERPDSEVLAVLNRALELDTKRVATRLSIARFYTGKQNVVKAEEMFKKAIEMKDVSALVHIEYGNFLNINKQTEEAEKHYRRAIEIEPGNRDAHKALARFCVVVGQREKAEESYKALASLDPANPEGRALLADFYVVIGKTDEAIKIYQEAVNQWPDYGRGRSRLGEIMLQRGDLQGALVQAEELLKKNSRDVDGLILRARVNLERGATKDALKDLDEVVRNQPTSRSGWFYIAEARLRSGQIDLARAAAAEIERQYPSYFSGKLIGAQISFVAGDTKSALRFGDEMVQMLEKAVPSGEISPQSLAELRAKAFTVRGLAQLSLGNTAAARVDLTEAQKQSPNAASSYNNLGRVALDEKKADEAVANYEQALKIDRKNFDALNGLISAYAIQGKLDQAHARIDQAINENANDVKLLASLRYLKSQVFAMQKNSQAAEKELATALRLDANYLPAYSAHAALLANANRVDEAIAQYQKVLERKPDNATTFTLIAMLEEGRGNIDAAVGGYRKALQLNNDSAVAANNLAWLYAVHGKGNIDEAVKLAQDIVQKYPEEPSYADTLGWIYYKKGIYSVAVQQLQKCVELDAANATKLGAKPTPAYRYRLGMALAANGDKNGARREIEQALALGQFPEAEEARRALSTL
jgi:tetratricopeptide (TPR) repeat protein